MRYLAPLPNPKVIDAAELAALHQAMKPVGLVWEVGAHDSDGGYDQGHNYGTQARAQARALGFPDSVPIYWAVDKRLTNITRNTALDYGHGFRDAAGASRPYGEAALIDAAVGFGLCDGGWCPETWGHSDHIVLSQVVGESDVPDTDANNIIRADWGGWHPDIPTPGADMDLTADNLHAIAEAVTVRLNQDCARPGTTGIGTTMIATDNNVSVCLQMLTELLAKNGTVQLDPKAFAQAVVDAGIGADVARHIGELLAPKA
jgi:hypothetical protein